MIALPLVCRLSLHFCVLFLNYRHPNSLPYMLYLELNDLGRRISSDENGTIKVSHNGKQLHVGYVFVRIFAPLDIKYKPLAAVQTKLHN